MASLSIKSASDGRSEIRVALGESFGTLIEQPLKNNILGNIKKRIEKINLCFDMAYITPKVKNIVYIIPYMSKRLKVLRGITQRSFSYQFRKQVSLKLRMDKVS
jgi:hypothetical protein